MQAWRYLVKKGTLRDLENPKKLNDWGDKGGNWL